MKDYFILCRSWDLGLHNQMQCSFIPRTLIFWAVNSGGNINRILKFTDENVALHHRPHHHVMPSAWISLTLSHHLSRSFITSGRSSGLHPVSSQTCCMYVRAGRPAFARSCEGVHRSTSLMSSSLLLHQCLSCLVRLILIVFVMGGRWPYSCGFVGCCLQDQFNIARSIRV